MNGRLCLSQQGCMIDRRAANRYTQPSPCLSRSAPSPPIAATTAKPMRLSIQALPLACVPLRAYTSLLLPTPHEAVINTLNRGSIEAVVDFAARQRHRWPRRCVVARSRHQRNIPLVPCVEFPSTFWQVPAPYRKGLLCMVRYKYNRYSDDSRTIIAVTACCARGWLVTAIG